MHPSKDPHVVMSSMETSQVLAFLQALSRVCSVPRAQYAVASFAPGSAAPSGGSAELCPRLEDLLSIAREGSSLQVMEAEDPFNENFACVDGLRYSEAQARPTFSGGAGTLGGAHLRRCCLATACRAAYVWSVERCDCAAFVEISMLRYVQPLQILRTASACLPPHVRASVTAPRAKCVSVLKACSRLP